MAVRPEISLRAISLEMVDKLMDFALNVPGEKTWWMTRLAMYKALQGSLKNLDGPDTSCLAISRSESFGRKVLGLNKCKYVLADYPEYNIMDLKFPDDQFDFCISDQVFEHIEGDPFKAFSETARVVKRGGIVCHTTCMINNVHGVPKDFWRFTPDALSLLATHAGLEPVAVGSWGNREVSSIMQPRFRFMKIPDDPKNPIYQLAMKNEPDWPISVWITARKP